MNGSTSMGKRISVALAAAALLAFGASEVRAQSAAPPDNKTTLDIYGFAQLDTGAQFKQNDPDWFDVVRPTKLPSFPNQYGEDGRWFSSVRQSRFGVRTSTPTDLGELKTIFEFELFGVGVDA